MSKFVVKEERVCAKWHLRHKTTDIWQTKQSRAKVKKLIVLSINHLTIKCSSVNIP